MATKEIKVQGLTLYVTDAHIYHRGEFIFHCRELYLSEITLKEATNVDEAMKGAVGFIKDYLFGKMTALETLELKVLEETRWL